MKDISELVLLSEKAYRERDFARAKVLLDEIIDRTPDSADGLGSRHLRAMAYEFGNMPGGVDLQKALIDYRYLVDKLEVVGSEGLIGAARVLCTIDLMDNFAEAEELSLLAVRDSGDARAKMLLGYMHMEVGNFDHARKWFFSAFIRGSKWGLKYYSATHFRQSNLVRGAIFHSLSFIFWPMLSVFHKARSPYV